MRYIGTKTDLLSEIADFIKQQGILSDSNLTFCDAFSGTAAVSDYFKSNFKITANDNAGKTKYPRLNISKA